MMISLPPFLLPSSADPSVNIMSSAFSSSLRQCSAFLFIFNTEVDLETSSPAAVLIVVHPVVDLSFWCWVLMTAW